MAVNELVTSRAQPADQPRTARKTLRVVAVEALGPLTILGGIVWAFAQPYLVVVVGLLFSLLVAPGLVDDLERSGSERGDAAAR